MSKKKKRRKKKKARDIVTLMMILSRKGGTMDHRCEPRGGAFNDQPEFIEWNNDDTNCD